MDRITGVAAPVYSHGEVAAVSSLSLLAEAAIVGDALGKPCTGFKSAHLLQLRSGEAVEGYFAKPVIDPEHPERNHLPGLHGPAGQLLLAGLALNVADESGREPIASLGARMLDLTSEEEDKGIRFGSWRGAGRPLRRALRAWKDAFPWEAQDFFATDEKSDGAGCLPHGIAAAALGGGEDDKTIREMARLTHVRPDAVLAPALLANLLVKLSTAGKSNRQAIEEILRSAIDSLKEWEREYLAEQEIHFREIGWGAPSRLLSRALEPLPSLLREANDELALKTILATAGEFSPAAGNPSHVQHGMACVLVPWVLYRGLGNLPARRAVEDVLNRGGEASIAAMAVCALHVARHGAECLPDEWYEGAIGRPLVQKVIDGQIEQWMNGEAAWTGKEEALREPLREAVRKQEQIDIEKGRIKPKSAKTPDQGTAPFPPPPHLWLSPEDEEDPEKKRILRAARGRKKIDWKEERRHNERRKDSD